MILANQHDAHSGALLDDPIRASVIIRDHTPAQVAALLYTLLEHKSATDSGTLLQLLGCMVAKSTVLGALGYAYRKGITRQRHPYQLVRRSDV